MATTKTCAECGTAISRQSTWCVRCNAQRRAVPKPKCADCGQEVAPGSKRCSSCARAARKTGLSQFLQRRRVWKPETPARVKPSRKIAPPTYTSARKCPGCGHTFSPAIKECTLCGRATEPYKMRVYGHADVPEVRVG